MWSLQNLSKKQNAECGTKIYGYSMGLVVSFLLVFMILCFLMFRINTGDKEISIENGMEMLSIYLSNAKGTTFYLQTILSYIVIVPFKFFIAKEFVFIFYDELLTRSLSSKIDKLKKYTSINNVYTNDMVIKLKKDLYVLMRQPYLRISNFRYYLITFLLAMPLMAYSLYFLFIDF